MRLALSDRQLATRVQQVRHPTMIVSWRTCSYAAARTTPNTNLRPSGLIHGLCRPGVEAQSAGAWTPLSMRVAAMPQQGKHRRQTGSKVALPLVIVAWHWLH